MLGGLEFRRHGFHDCHEDHFGSAELATSGDSFPSPSETTRHQNTNSLFRLLSEIRARDIYTTTGRAGGRGAGDRFSYGFSRLGRPLRPPHRGAVAGGAVPNKKNHGKIDLLRPPSGPRRPVVVYISRAPGPVGAAPFPGQGAERHLRGGSTMPESRAGSESGRLGNNAEHQRKTSTKPSNPQKLRDLARERFLYQHPYCKHRFSCPCCRTDQPPRERHAMTRCVNHNCTRTNATKS